MRSTPFIPNANELAYSSLRVASGYGGHGWYSLPTIFKSSGFSSVGTIVVTMSLREDKNARTVIKEHGGEG